MPPMLEKLPTRQGEAARWSNKGAFEQSVLQSSIGETRVNKSRLIISLLAINFLPAVVFGGTTQFAIGYSATRASLFGSVLFSYPS